MKKTGISSEAIEKKPRAAMVYCGPDIPFVAKQFDSFSNGLPEKLEALALASYAVAALIVPVEQLAQTRAELMKPGSALQNIFVQAEKDIKRRG